MTVETLMRQYHKLSETDKRRFIALIKEESDIDLLESWDVPEFYTEMDRRLQIMISGQDKGLPAHEAIKDMKAKSN
ncbi:MAG: hypothetical protein AAF694_04260 [Bacteroidota bacterium]